MDRLTEMEAFANVVDQGGFTDAARKLGVSKSAVSKYVSALEKRLGVKLLSRTTRRVSPTELGLAYYDKVRDVLLQARAADSMVSSIQDEPNGSLNVLAPQDFGALYVAPALNGFLKRFPNLNINLVLSDDQIDLQAEKFDVAIQFDGSSDGPLRARKLGQFYMGLIASQSYLSENGTPKNISELTNHQLLHTSHSVEGNYWKLIAPNGEYRIIRNGGMLTVNDKKTLLNAARDGLGIAYLPSYYFTDALKRGQLVQILPNLPEQRKDIHLIYVLEGYPRLKLNFLIDCMTSYLDEAL